MRTKQGRGWTVADLRSGEKSPAKMRRMVFWARGRVSTLILEDRVHAMTLPNQLTLK